MYQQIMEQITRRIAVGDWPPETVLPSIRQLATEIRVSIITVKRAYLELEREGVIVTQQGKGCWVNNGLDLNALQKKELQQYLKHAARLVEGLGLSEKEVLQMMKKHL